jgi:hypothetical protein
MTPGSLPILEGNIGALLTTARADYCGVMRRPVAGAAKDVDATRG